MNRLFIIEVVITYKVKIGHKHEEQIQTHFIKYFYYKHEEQIQTHFIKYFYLFYKLL